MQHATIGGPTPYGLPLNETTIAQRLKSQGYSTHMVGKVSTKLYLHVVSRYKPVLDWYELKFNPVG